MNQFLKKDSLCFVFAFAMAQPRDDAILMEARHLSQLATVAILGRLAEDEGNVSVEDVLDEADVQFGERVEIATAVLDADGGPDHTVWWPGRLVRATDPLTFVHRRPAFEVEFDEMPPVFPAGVERVVFLDDNAVWVLPSTTPARWRLEGEDATEAPFSDQELEHYGHYANPAAAVVAASANVGESPEGRVAEASITARAANLPADVAARLMERTRGFINNASIAMRQAIEQGRDVNDPDVVRELVAGIPRPPL